MKLKGYEWCPYCENEQEYSVGEGTWIVKCKKCGRPLLLCDRCLDHSHCGNCPHERKLNREMSKWSKGQVGKIVYWKDPDNDECSDWCRVIEVVEDVYVLSHLFYPDRCESIVEAYWNELDFVDEEKQIEVWESFFKSENYRNGMITLDNSYRK